MWRFFDRRVTALLLATAPALGAVDPSVLELDSVRKQVAKARGGR